MYQNQIFENLMIYLNFISKKLFFDKEIISLFIKENNYFVFSIYNFNF